MLGLAVVICAVVTRQAMNGIRQRLFSCCNPEEMEAAGHGHGHARDPSGGGQKAGHDALSTAAAQEDDSSPILDRRALCIPTSRELKCVHISGCH